MDKLKERAMLREVQRLQRTGKMPTLQELTEAILETRREFRWKILRARREARAQKEEAGDARTPPSICTKQSNLAV